MNLEKGDFNNLEYIYYKMSKRNKIQKLKAQLEEELNRPQPNMEKVQKLKNQIVMYGMGLTGRDLTKPF